ncbi:ATP-binding protein [Geodermatophilus poikilotrophus]|uniref:ATPase family associated with various cellular activities (AAA) n=1 Tax=Geodermatophilus poikilotrophus TaxID=1333667 RepID=A0A1H9Z118_9ACTN|nr:ATP-binding protein [Geodermatophilus poikilotrophus]SES75044.1 ATPase family associated with various cellular activities (AAA) [Geodermatophilus poikilotrophus]
MTTTDLRDTDDRLMDATMTWLRAVLVPPRQHGHAPAAVDPESPAYAPTSGRLWGRRPPPRPELVVPDPEPEDRRGAARRARRRLEEALAAQPRPRFTRLCDALGLRPFEQDVALLCLAHAVSTEIAALCRAMPESAAGAPTFALSLSLAMDDEFDAASPERRAEMTRIAAVPEWAALGPDRPLRSWRLVDIIQGPAQALVSSALRMDERIVDHVRGRDYVDDRLAPVLDALHADRRDTVVSPAQRSRLDLALDHLRRLPPGSDRLLVQMPGGDSATKRLFAHRIAGAVGLDLCRLPVAQIPPGVDLAVLVDLWNRETRLQGVALLVEADSATEEATRVLGRLLTRLVGLVFLDVREPLSQQDTTFVLDVSRPRAAEQRSMWEEVLAGTPGEWPERLAGQFDLNAGEIADVADEVGDDGAGAWDTCRLRVRPRLEGLAQRIVTETRLADVKLPEREQRLLEQVRDQARHRVRVYDEYGFRSRLSRGLGITALLAGESGTGKTMAAEALANELRLDLYRIDLASVVSKYIGETEKNLRQVFDAAEQGGSVLLFDEADAIFGKRSEVQDSHDRYANIEVSYLLQRMEAYRGLAILTTNMKAALDPAFLRRLRFVIAFPFPGPVERERIWRAVFPEDTTPDPETGQVGTAGGPRRWQVPGVDRLDMVALARPGMTGGQIRNVALNATFLAVARDGAVTMELLEEAARQELRKSGRPFVAADFAGWVTRPDRPADAHRTELDGVREPVLVGRPS